MTATYHVCLIMLEASLEGKDAVKDIIGQMLG